MSERFLMLDHRDLERAHERRRLRRCVPNLPPYARPRVRLPCEPIMVEMPTAAHADNQVGTRHVPEPRMVNYQRVGQRAGQ